MRLTRWTAATAAGALLTFGLVASSASAVTTDHDVRPSDFTTGTSNGYANSDTRATGHEAFLKEGIHLWTEGSTSTDKVAEYFPVNLPLAGVTDVSYEWFGTTPSPGVQYVMDFDNNGTADGILVGESVYGGHDVWLTNGSDAAYKGTGAPSNTGGSGSDNHGTLAEWSTKYPNARILFGGFSLGSGVKGDGVLRSVSYGADRFVFTSEAAPVVVPDQTHVPVTGSLKVTKKVRKIYVALRSNVQPTTDNGRGARLHWQIKVDGVQRFNAYNGWNGVSNWSWTFAKKTGPHVVVVLMNGKAVKTSTIPTGKP